MTITNRNSFLLLIIILFNTQVLAKLKVVTSITPLASIAAMLLEDNAEITTVAASNSCPHHFHPTPSSLKAVKDADINIYIDESFDGFAHKLMKNNSKNIIRIGDFNLLNILKDSKGQNWHLWLDLNNVHIILVELSKKFTSQFPNLKKVIENNLEKSLLRITELSKIKKQKLLQVANIVLLSDSLEYFFAGNLSSVKNFEPDHKSLKFLKLLDSLLLNANKQYCLILSTDQNIEFYKKYRYPVVQLESENWIAEDDLKNLYFNKYLKMLEELQLCTHN